MSHFHTICLLVILCFCPSVLCHSTLMSVRVSLTSKLLSLFTCTCFFSHFQKNLLVFSLSIFLSLFLIFRICLCLFSHVSLSLFTQSVSSTFSISLLFWCFAGYPVGLCSIMIEGHNMEKLCKVPVFPWPLKFLHQCTRIFFYGRF